MWITFDGQRVVERADPPAVCYMQSFAIQAGKLADGGWRVVLLQDFARTDADATR